MQQESRSFRAHCTPPASNSQACTGSGQPRRLSFKAATAQAASRPSLWQRPAPQAFGLAQRKQLVAQRTAGTVVYRKSECTALALAEPELACTVRKPAASSSGAPVAKATAEVEEEGREKQMLSVASTSSRAASPRSKAAPSSCTACPAASSAVGRRAASSTNGTATVTARARLLQTGPAAWPCSPPCSQPARRAASQKGEERKRQLGLHSMMTLRAGRACAALYRNFSAH